MAIREEGRLHVDERGRTWVDGVEMTSGMSSDSTSTASSHSFHTGGTDIRFPDSSGEIVFGHFETDVEYVDDHEEIDEKEAEKIGTPGKRNIDDLLAAFKMTKNKKTANTAIENLEDQTWAELVAETVEPPKVDIPSEPRGT